MLFRSAEAGDPGDLCLRPVLQDCLGNAAVSIPEQSFPLIIRKGINRHSEEITFVFNYSNDSMTYTASKDYTDLVSKNCYNEGAKIGLDPWGYLILKGN